MLKVEHVCKSFSGLAAVNDISLEVPSRSVTALIGPNGAGKTTLFNLIAGVISPDSGHIYLDDLEITGMKPYEICKCRISRTFQVIKLFSNMSVLDNVLVGMHSRIPTNTLQDIFHLPQMRAYEKTCKEKAHALLDFVGLSALSSSKAGSLSYGQQRLLEIARSLASDPKLVLLDEPAAGMNSAEKASLNERIRTITGMGITVLIVEHDMEMVMNIADHIYAINSGRYLAEGSPDAILSNEDVIEAYLGRGDF